MIVLEEAIKNKGLSLLKEIKSHKNSIFDTQYWMGLLMEWVMKDPSFKVDLFRFVDVLPSLKTSAQISNHIEEYLLKQGRELPLVISTALKAASSFGLSKGVAQSILKSNINDMACRFIIGDTIEKVKKALVGLERENFKFTVDILGEAIVNEQEANDYYEKISVLISELASFKDPNISIKITSLSSKLNHLDPDYSVDLLKERLMPLIRHAKKHNVFINFDMESHASLEIINQLFVSIAKEQEFIDWPKLGIVAQAYLKESPQHVISYIELAKKRMTPITIRLVKGAYWDYEIIHSQQTGIKPKVFLQKPQTDDNYEYLTKMLLDNISITNPAFASHNIRSLSHALCYAESKQIPQNKYELQMLYGMADEEKKVFSNHGYNVRIYCPMGEMIAGMAYLVRRLLENTSQMGFIKLAHHDEQKEEFLLQKPLFELENKKNNLFNAALSDFSLARIRCEFDDNVKKIITSLPIEVPIVINQENHNTAMKITRVNPCKNNQVISYTSRSTSIHGDIAIKVSKQNQAKLWQLGLDTRCQHLYNLAKILHEDRSYLSAVLALEVGKPLAQADAEIAEAIDFCNLYAECAQKLKPHKIYSVAGEENWQYYLAKGVAAIISPWNFPLAILCGMSVANYVVGNPIIIKPAEQASLCGYELYKRMIKSGFLASSVQFLPGVGEEVGAYLVNSPHVLSLCFTGSLNVGLKIINSANQKENIHNSLKRITAEMGGKNAIIIDEDADMDEAIEACIKSAFEFAGQKCSALSRIIILESVFDSFSERFILSAKKLCLTLATNKYCDVPALIDEESFIKTKSLINNLKQDSKIKILYEGEYADNGFYIPPIIMQTSFLDHMCMQEEFFAPIVTLYKAANLDEALDVANNTSFALTGGFFSRSPFNIQKIKEKFNVGNLYINQKCTGAYVKRQPFGGFKMSGVGAKAGGLDYLYNFVDTKIVCENTMRKGFSPEIVN